MKSPAIRAMLIALILIVISFFVSVRSISVSCKDDSISTNCGSSDTYYGAPFEIRERTVDKADTVQNTYFPDQIVLNFAMYFASLYILFKIIEYITNRNKLPLPNTQSETMPAWKKVLGVIASIAIVGLYLSAWGLISFFSGLSESNSMTLARFAVVIVGVITFFNTVFRKELFAKPRTRTLLLALSVVLVFGSFAGIAISSKDYLPIPDRLDPNLLVSVGGDKNKIKKFYDYHVAFLVQAEQYWMIETDEKTLNEIVDFFGMELVLFEESNVLTSGAGKPAWWPKSLPEGALIYRNKQGYNGPIKDGRIPYQIMWDPNTHRIYANIT